MYYIHIPPGQNIAQGAGIEQKSPRPGQEKIIEEIKKRSPIWKKEHYENEDSAWLKGNPIAKEEI